MVLVGRYDLALIQQNVADSAGQSFWRLLSGLEGLATGTGK